jgi:hypothetical protein
MVRSRKYGVVFRDLFARGAMAARQVLTLKIEVRVLAGEPSGRIVAVSTVCVRAWPFRSD